jgi:hypothetical protein
LALHVRSHHNGELAPRALGVRHEARHAPAVQSTISIAPDRHQRHMPVAVDTGEVGGLGRAQAWYGMKEAHAHIVRCQPLEAGLQSGRIFQADGPREYRLTVGQSKRCFQVPEVG